MLLNFGRQVIFEGNSMRRFPLSIWVLLLVSLGAISSASAAPGAVRCGKLLDVRTGRVLSDQLILFEANGTITSVGAAVASGVTPIDLSLATCLPGLIDVHTH